MSWIEKLYPIPAKGTYSQFGEDLILEQILAEVGETNRFCVDLGAGQYSGEMSNTQLLVDRGWTRLAFDANPEPESGIKKGWIAPETINDLLQENECPKDFDFLSLDIDSSDYWVLEQVLQDFRPRIICAEFNGCLDPTVPKVLQYEEGYMWDGTDKYGFSWAAGRDLLHSFGYSVILNQNDTNIWAVAHEVIGAIKIPPIRINRNQYHPHNPNAKFITPQL